MATGMTLCGFSVSPAAMPISSVPESEVNRHHQDRQTAVREPAFGGEIAQPGAGEPSCIGMMPKIAARRE